MKRSLGRYCNLRFSSALCLLWGLRLIRALPAENNRTRRDENESVSTSFGRGVGFFLGEPCNKTCNSILYHIYCNTTTNHCECMEKYPVKLDDKLCVQALKLNDPCEHTASCLFYEPNSICHEQEKHCRCQVGYRGKVDAFGEEACSPVKSTGFIDNSELTTMVSVIGGLMIFTALFCLVLRLFSRARFNRPRDRLATTGAPPPVVLDGLEGKSASQGSSRRPSRSSGASNDLYSGSRRPSLILVAPPPSRPGSRRPSSASQGSLRSSSFRSQASPHMPPGRTLSLNRRDPVRRTASSPTPGVSGFRAQLQDCKTETPLGVYPEVATIMTTNHPK